MCNFEVRHHFYWPFRPCYIVLIISILNQVLFIVNVMIDRFKVAKEIKGKSAISIEIKCTHYKSHRSEHNSFFPMIHRGLGKRLWYTLHSLGEHRYTGFPDRMPLLGPLITKTKTNCSYKDQAKLLFH